MSSLCIGTRIGSGKLSLALLPLPQQQRTAAPCSVYTAHPSRNRSGGSEKSEIISNLKVTFIQFLNGFQYHLDPNTSNVSYASNELLLPE